MKADSQPEPQSGGFPYAVGAYVCWGFIPLYFALLKGIGPAEILAHRVIWSLPFIYLIIMLRGQWREFRDTLANPVALRTMALSSVLITTNWLIYVWAVVEGHILATSIGYYLNPLVNVLLGRLVLGERLTRMQAVAVTVAGVAVAILAFGALDTLWISVSLAFSFGSYGLVRKMAPAGAVPGLAIELGIMAPFAATMIGWSFYQGHGTKDLPMLLLLSAGGLVTVIPLLMFATAARRMSYSALGFVQYLAPTIVFFLGLFHFGEPLDSTRLACFVLIWVAVAIFCWDTLQRHGAHESR
jgi:chloramphenicol-sensitive protein RarD